MAKSSEEPCSYLSGFVQNREIGRVIGQIDELREIGAPDSLLLKWVKADDQWYSFKMKWTATRMWVLEKPEVQIFVLEPQGTVGVGTVQGMAEEEVDSSGDGPTRSGPFRDLRFIGDHLYAAGMSRQVYRREGPNRWVRRDAGVLQPAGTLEVAGFNSIDGLKESDMYAVGFGGEVWRYFGNSWYQIDSPTNVVLERVRVVKPDLVFACGQGGVVLRGHGDIWEQIEHDVTDEDLWGMEWFKDSLYVSSESGIFGLNEYFELEPVDMGLGKPWTCRHLHANDGVMWSFGPKHIAWTEDAKTWNDVTP